MTTNGLEPGLVEEARVLVRRIQWDVNQASARHAAALAELEAAERQRARMLDELSAALEAACALHVELDRLRPEVRAEIARHGSARQPRCRG